MQCVDSGTCGRVREDKQNPRCSARNRLHRSFCDLVDFRGGLFQNFGNLRKALTVGIMSPICAVCGASNLTHCLVQANGALAEEAAPEAAAEEAVAEEAPAAEEVAAEDKAEG